MKTSTALHLLLCALLLAFSTLAAALAVVDPCLQPEAAHADCVSLHGEPADEPLQATAELLCQMGGGCHVSAALPVSTSLPLGALPCCTPLALSVPVTPEISPDTLWRPPRA